MKIKFIWIGRSKDRHCTSLVDEYRKRLSHYCTLEIAELKEIKAGKMSASEAMKREADVFMKHVQATDWLVLLDERGVQHTSVELSQMLQTKMNAALPRLVFLIGGAWGIDPTVRQRANAVWSLSKLTFTHDMARIVAIEQIYRALTILRGEKYHNETVT